MWPRGSAASRSRASDRCPSPPLSSEYGTSGIVKRVRQSRPDYGRVSCGLLVALSLGRMSLMALSLGRESVKHFELFALGCSRGGQPPRAAVLPPGSSPL